eukprot:4995925-Amphidinium_carterae.1
MTVLIENPFTFRPFFLPYVWGLRDDIAIICQIDRVAAMAMSAFVSFGEVYNDPQRVSPHSRVTKLSKHKTIESNRFTVGQFLLVKLG